MPIYSNSDMARTIAEYVHNQRHRELLRLRYCEGLTYEEISEKTSYCPDHIKRLCKEYKPLLLSLL